MAAAFEAVARSLKGESERGTIVLGVAWLDESLTKVLNIYLNSGPNSKENLLSPGCPLGDLGTKIIISKRLNLINDYVVDSLTICRKLRNEFAHVATELSFSTPSVKDRIEHLFKLNEDIIKAMSSSLPDSKLLKAADNSGSTSIETMHNLFGTKELFRFLCGIINSGLAGIEYGLQQSKPTYDSELLK